MGWTATWVNSRTLAAMQGGRIIFITHSEHANPGAVAEALHAHGYETKICCPFLGDALPPLNDGKPEGFAGSIVFGGAMGVKDAAEMERFRDSLREAGLPE